MVRGCGQRGPLVEYQREGYDMFSAMMEGIKEESVGSLFNLQVEKQENPIVEDAPPDGVFPGGALGGAVLGGAVPGAAGPGDPGLSDPTPGGLVAGVPRPGARRPAAP